MKTYGNCTLHVIWYSCLITCLVFIVEIFAQRIFPFLGITNKTFFVENDFRLFRTPLPGTFVMRTRVRIRTKCRTVAF